MSKTTATLVPGQPVILAPAGAISFAIDEGLTAENYCGGGYYSEALNVARDGDAGRGKPDCQSNLESAIRGYGLDRGNFNIDACFNVFMTVADDADGKWEIRPRASPATTWRCARSGRRSSPSRTARSCSTPATTSGSSR